jgi:O-antigen/teichoic acid export membrane protein
LKTLFKKMFSSRLIKSGIFFTIGMFFIQGINFFTVPIFTRLLTPDDFGTVNIFTNNVSIFTVIISLGLVAAVSNAKYDFKEDFEKFLSSILFLASISFLIWLVIAMVLKQFIAIKLEMNSSLLMLMMLQSFFAFVIDFASTKYTIQYKYNKFLFISITSTIINIILSIILIKGLAENRYYGRIYGAAYVTIIYGAILYIIFMIKGKKLINIKYWKYALTISLPMILHSLSSIILTTFGTLMIAKIIDNSAAGIYSFAYKIGMILNVVWAATNKAWVPWFYEKMSEGKQKDITETSKYYIALFSLITFVLIFISPEIGKVMGGKEYQQGVGLVPVIMIGYYFVFLYSLPANLEFYTKKTQYIAVGTIMAGVANIILNLIFIPRFGFIAAGWTTVISYLLLFVYHYIIALKISEERIFKIKYFIYGTSFVAGSSGIFYFIKEMWIIRYAIIIVVCLIIGFNLKKKIAVFLNK